MLSRKILFDHFQAPNCVLDEMLSCEGIQDPTIWERHIKLFRIESLETKVEKIDFDDQKCLGYISRFVEPKFFPFKRKALREAFDHLMKWETSVLENLEDYEFGIKTNDSPFVLNACMIYKSCLKRGIHVSYNETPQHMLFKAKLFDSPKSKLRNLANLSLFCLPKNEMFNLLMCVMRSGNYPCDVDSPRVSFNEIGYLSVDNFIKNCPPKNQEEAKLALILKYRIIVSGVDLDTLKLFKCFEDDTPFDDERYLINKDYFSMNSRFVEEFESMYTKTEIESILSKECVVSKNQLCHSPEFIHGIHPDSISAETLVDLMNVREIESPDDCVTFLGAEKSVLSKEELGRYIIQIGPINPCTGKYLSQTSIKKLKKLNFKDVNNALLIQEKKKEHACLGMEKEWLTLKEVLDIDLSKDDFDLKMFDILNQFYGMIESNILETKMTRLIQSSDSGLEYLPSDVTLGEFIENLKNVDAENSCLDNAKKILKDTIWWNLFNLTGKSPFDLNFYCQQKG